MSAYLAFASLVWGFADARADQPLDLEAFDAAPAGGRIWRFAHLSDLHVVGERYGFRIESGRSGPRGNGRLERVFARLAALHAKQPLDLVLVTGDMTDAGTSAEWAEFLDIVGAHPELAAADAHSARQPRRQYRRSGQSGPSRSRRSARSRLCERCARSPHSPPSRACGCDGHDAQTPGSTLSEALESRRTAIEEFAVQRRLPSIRRARPPLAGALPADPPARPGRWPRGGDPQFECRHEFLVHQCARTHGRRPGASAHRTFDRFPKARWIVALHHHLTEYPMPVAAFSERVGTALINGTGSCGS